MSNCFYSVPGGDLYFVWISVVIPFKWEFFRLNETATILTHFSFYKMSFYEKLRCVFTGNKKWCSVDVILLLK